MMNNKQETYPKDFLFADVIAYTLLNLYITVAYSKRYVPARTRNDILLRQLKGYWALLLNSAYERTLAKSYTF